jgi:hypothetical protein
LEEAEQLGAAALVEAFAGLGQQSSACTTQNSLRSRSSIAVNEYDGWPRLVCSA